MSNKDIKLGIGAFVCKELRAEGIDFLAHYNDAVVTGRKHKWVGNMRDITPRRKAKIEHRIELKLVAAGYRFRECRFCISTRGYMTRDMFIVRN